MWNFLAVAVLQKVFKRCGPGPQCLKVGFSHHDFILEHLEKRQGLLLDEHGIDDQSVDLRIFSDEHQVFRA